jgi:hypothetical protein
MNFIEFGLADWQFSLFAWDAGLIMVGHGSIVAILSSGRNLDVLTFSAALCRLPGTLNQADMMRDRHRRQFLISGVIAAATVVALAGINIVTVSFGHDSDEHYPVAVCRGDGVWSVEECAAIDHSASAQWVDHPVALDVPGGENWQAERSDSTGLTYGAFVKMCSIDRGRLAWPVERDGLCRREDPFKPSGFWALDDLHHIQFEWAIENHDISFINVCRGDGRNSLQVCSYMDRREALAWVNSPQRVTRRKVNYSSCGLVAGHGCVPADVCEFDDHSFLLVAPGAPCGAGGQQQLVEQALQTPERSL